MVDYVPMSYLFKKNPEDPWNHPTDVTITFHNGRTISFRATIYKDRNDFDTESIWLFEGYDIEERAAFENLQRI